MDTASQTTLVSDYDQFFNDMWEEVKSELDEKEFQKVRQIEDRAAFEAFLDEVRTQSTDYKDGTKSKWRRMRGHVQRICAQLSEFLECYSGVAEVAKGIHQQGGALGYGTLSVLLMLVREKEVREEMIGAYLGQAKRCLQDLKDWQSIYCSIDCPPLTTVIMEVYREIFRFSMFTWKYYKRRRERWRIHRPAKNGLQIDLDKLKAVVKRVNDETEKLHHARQEELHRRLSDIDQTRKDERYREWQHQCTLYRHRLRCPQVIDPAHRSKELEEELEALTEANPHTYATMEVGDMKALRASEVYREWEGTPQSGMLFAWTLNHHDSSPISPVWLSPALTELALDLRAQDDTRVIYHAIDNSRESPCVILSIIICEILAWDQDFFTAQKQMIEIAWEMERNIATSPSELTGLICKLLEQWNAAYPGDRIIILIDGFHNWLPPNVDLTYGLWREVLDGLLKCVQVRGCIKICFLAEYVEWKKDVGRIANLQAAFMGLEGKIWNSGVLRQGNRVEFGDGASCE